MTMTTTTTTTTPTSKIGNEGLNYESTDAVPLFSVVERNILQTIDLVYLAGFHESKHISTTVSTFKGCWVAQ